MKFAKKVSSYLPPFSLRKMLHERLEYVDKERKRSPIHASDLTNQQTPFCPREFVLLDILQVKKKESFIPTALAYTFKLGRMIETGVRDWFGPAAYGFWKCVRCGRETGFTARPIACGTCGSKEWRYREPVLYSKEHDVSGSVDLYVKPEGHTKAVLVECKSISKDEFAKLQAPLTEHRLRTMLYLYLQSKSGYFWINGVDPSLAVVLYAIKGHGKKDDTLHLTGYKGSSMTPFKEYFVRLDESIIAPYLEKAKMVAQFREKGGPIPDGICSTLLCPRAKKCSVAKACFSGEYKPGSFLKKE